MDASPIVSQGSEEEISVDLPFEEAIINLLQTQVLGSKLNYKTLLEMKGTSAQRILNIFQKVVKNIDYGKITSLVFTPVVGFS